VVIRHDSIYACENLTAKVRRIEAIRLLDESPYLILCMFVAARFYVSNFTFSIPFNPAQPF
jgi:hypothetical protein